MAMNTSDVMEDLAYSDAEGAADLWGEDEADMLEDEFEDDFEDDFNSMKDDFDGMEDGFESDEEAGEVIGRVLGSVLGAEDEDEFLGGLLKSAKTLVSKAAPVLGKIARGAAPILSMIPHPAAQIGSQVANVLGKLRAEGASIEDALEAVAEVAAYDARAIPIVSGLAARSLLKNRAASMPVGQRKQVAETMLRAATTLVKQGGPKAIRALPKITKSVQRTTAAGGTPAAARPRVVASTAAKVAENPTMLRRLSAPSPQGQALARRAANGTGSNGRRTRSIRVPGPATIRITVG